MHLERIKFPKSTPRSEQKQYSNSIGDCIRGSIKDTPTKRRTEKPVRKPKWSGCIRWFRGLFAATALCPSGKPDHGNRSAQVLYWKRTGSNKGEFRHAALVGKVRDFMTAEVQTCGLHDNIVDVAMDMIAKGHRRRPVVEKGKLIGQLTCRRILRVVAAFNDRGGE